MAKGPNGANSSTGAGIAGLDLQELKAKQRQMALSSLRQETSVLEMRTRGFSEFQIAQALGCTEKEVKQQLNAMFIDQSLANQDQVRVDRGVAVARYEQAIQALQKKAFGSNEGQWDEYRERLAQGHDVEEPETKVDLAAAKVLRDYMKDLNKIQGLNETTVVVKDGRDPEAVAMTQAISQDPAVRAAVAAAHRAKLAKNVTPE